MAVIDSAELLAQGSNYSGSGNWLDESGNGHHLVPTGSPTFTTDHFTTNGSSQYLTASADSGLDFAADQDFTLMIVLSVADLTPASEACFVAHKSGAITANPAGYAIGNGSGGAVSVRQGTGAALLNDAVSGMSESTITVLTARRDTVAAEFEGFIDGTGTGTPDTDTNADITSAQPFRIGANSQTTPAEYSAIDIYAVALWRSALSDADIATAGDELQGIGLVAVNRTNIIFVAAD